MGQRGPRSNPLKAKALAALAAGEVTVPEAAMLAAVTPGRVWQWCADAGIDPREARRTHVKQLWAQELRRQRMKSRGVKPKKRTKRQLRALGERAKSAWDRGESKL